jgi:two-component system phosphate regulon sensor histidine kinase PhoR
MHEEGKRMQQLIEDLMSLSRIEADRFRPPREPIDLAPLVEEVRAGCAQLLAERRNEVRLAIESASTLVPGDRGQLLQLLRNLIVNAVKYGARDSDVSVRIADAGGMLHLTVADRGEGIAPEHLPRLTERFYRVDAGRSRAEGGTGLGLAIVKHIVGRHRGRLEIRSTPGEGTQVHVYLPRLAEPSPEGLS